MRPDIAEWIAKAEGDFTVLNREMDSPNPVYDSVCFHAQQCIEKYLKAWLLAQGVHFPKTHHLWVLQELLLDKPPSWQALEPSLRRMDAAGVLFRYPGATASAELAGDIRQDCVETRLFIRKQLGLPG